MKSNENGQCSLVSIIIPIYGVEDYLEHCVRSILNQTYKNLEIILVDDGSPDGCPAMCDAYAKEDPRVIVIHKQNGGLSDARNAGMEIAKGGYIMFVDSDDWVAPEIVETLMNLLTGHDADIAECSYANVYKDRIEPKTKCTGEIIEATPIQSLSLMLDYRTFLPVAWGKLYRKDIMCGISFPVGRLHEDEFTTYKYHLNARRLVYIDMAFYFYNQMRSDSTMHKEYHLKRLDGCEAFRERMCLYWSLGFDELEPLMSNYYCWSLFDNLYQCWQNKLQGAQLSVTISEALVDYIEIKQRQIPLRKRYNKAFISLEKGLDIFGKRWHIITGGFLPKWLIIILRHVIHVFRK